MADLPRIDGGSSTTTGSEDLADWTVGGREPSTVVFPRTVDELAEVLGRASEEGWSVVAAGAGHWIDGGGPPPPVDLVVSTREMARVTEYEPGDLTLSAEAGLTLAGIADRSREHGQWLAQDPPGWQSGTLGAFVSTGLAGPLVAGFGRPRDHLLGVTLVTGDGRVLRPGGKVVKNVAGFDLVRLTAGSWGTLGVVAEATVRLFPLPRRDVSLVFEGRTDEMIAVARSLATASVLPEAVELIQSDGESGTKGDRPDARVVARLLGSREDVEERADLLVEAIGGEGPVTRIEGEHSGALHAGAGLVSGRISIRLSALPARLGAAMKEVDGIRSAVTEEGAEDRYDVPVRAFASVTRGTVRVEGGRVGGGRDVRGSIRMDSLATALQAARERLEDAGGRLAILRGPTDLFSRVPARGNPGAPAELMRGIKERMDPAGVLAPGRLGLETSEGIGAPAMETTE